MASSVFTLRGENMDGDRCKRVRSGKRRGCTILLCKTGRRWKFQKGTTQCDGGRRKRSRRR